jgi:hypothetical protein
VAASLLPVRQLWERTRLQVNSQCLLNSSSSNNKQLTPHIIRTLQMTGKSSSVVTEWITLVLLIWEIQGLILSLEADYPVFILFFLSLLTGKCWNTAIK